MKTLILDNYDSFTYNLFQYLAELEANPTVVRNDAISVEEIERSGFTHIVISPGPGDPTNPRDFGVCAEVIQKLQGKIPILGVCLGHQGIIAAFGGRVIRAPEPVHGKRSRIRVKNTHRLFAGLPETIEGMRYHSLIGEAASLPGELEVIAKTAADGLIMGVAHRTLPLFGVQFHPESIGTPQGKKILENFLKEKPARRKKKAPENLNEKEAQVLFLRMAKGEMNEDEIEKTLRILAQKGETAEEVCGMARGMLSLALPIPNLGKTPLLDTCGTGGSGMARMNISTAAAFVIAACGIPVAKHGNRAASGRCGSFDLLEALGLSIELPAAAVAESIRRLNIGFLYAPMFHPAMKALTAVRKKIGTRTIFNLLGPLVNPLRPTFHLLGTSSVHTAQVMAEASRKLGTKRTLVVAGADGLDEVTIAGKTAVFDVRGGKIFRSEISPEEAGLARQKIPAAKIGTARDNARLFKALLTGAAPDALRDLLLANCAFGLVAAGAARTAHDGVRLARKALESGAAQKKFTEYRDFTRS